ncbi:MAG: hypothetical protein ACOYN4_04835 [Bacteroidales bacterium]
MKTQNFEIYFNYVNLFLQGKGLNIADLKQTDLPEFVIFCQKYMNKEISDSITYQIICELSE